jgi:ankyrin repeat protein
MLFVYAHSCVYVFLLKWGNTALLLAISMNYIEAVRVLIARDAKITTKNKVDSLNLLYL